MIYGSQLLKAYVLKVTVYGGIIFPVWEFTHTVNVMYIVDTFTVGILIPLLK